MMSEASTLKQEQSPLNYTDHIEDPKYQSPQPSRHESEAADGDSTEVISGVETTCVPKSIFESDSSDDEPEMVEARSEFVTKREFEQLKAE